MNNKLKVLSLFSGCGGLDLGFEGGFDFLTKHYPKNNIEVIFANDIMPDACKSLQQNFTAQVVCDDIRKILKRKENGLPDCDIVTGGFPCQDFSLAGKRLGFKSERGLLYQSMKKVIELKKPKMFVAENVKGLMNLGNALETIKSDFMEIIPEYVVTHRLFNAANYEVPQTRERVLIFGIRKDVFEKLGEFEPPKEILAKSDWIPAKKAIGDLITKNKNIPNQDQYSKAKNYGAHMQGNKPIKADLPSITIRAEHHGNIEFHYSEPRRLTVRECARLQSFPDSFKFYGSGSSVYKQIGNAVPPILAWHVAKSIEKYLNKLN